MTMQYTVAVLCDIHGNADALEAVLDDLATQPHDATVIAGDLVLNGPRPADALALVQQTYAPTIYGNTDAAVLDTDAHGGALPPDMRAGVEWVRNKIGADGVAYLASLPFSHYIVPPDGEQPRDNLLIVHATPTDVNAVLLTEPNPYNPAMQTVTPEADAKRLLGDARANLVLYGHIHYFSAGNIGGQRVASIGAVGFPFDGDHRAAYALVTWDGEEWVVRRRRVVYDHEKTAAAAEASGAPFAARAAAMLRTAAFAP